MGPRPYPSARRVKDEAGTPDSLAHAPAPGASGPNRFTRGTHLDSCAERYRRLRSFSICRIDDFSSEIAADKWTSLLIAKRRLAGWFEWRNGGQWLLIVCAPSKTAFPWESKCSRPTG
jgi:hypothetical protein